MGLKEQAAVGVRWTMIGTIGTQVMNFGVLAILARELGPKAFGVVALAGIWVKFLNYFLSQGLGLAIIQRKDLSPKHIDSAFWLTIVMSIIIASLTAGTAPIVADFFSEPQLTDVLRVLSLSFIIGGFATIQVAVMTRDRKFKKLTSRGLAGNATGAAVAVALAFADAGVWALVARQLTTSVIMAIILWSTSSWRPRLRFSLPHLKELWGYSVNVFARNLVGFAYLEADKFLIGSLIGASQLGFYSNSKQLARMFVNTARKPVETVALPLLSKLQGDSTRMAHAICRSQSMMAVLLVPIFCGLASLAPEVVAIVFGPDWEFAKYPLRFLSFAEAINACSAVAFTSIMAVGRPGLSLLHLSISATTAIIATFIGARWGVVGISIAMLCNSVVYTGMFVAILVRITDVKLSAYVKSNLPAVIASIALSAATILVTSTLGVDSPLWLRTASGITAGVIVYVLVLRIISVESFETAKSIVLKAAGIKTP